MSILCSATSKLTKKKSVKPQTNLLQVENNKGWSMAMYARRNNVNRYFVDMLLDGLTWWWMKKTQAIQIGMCMFHYWPENIKNNGTKKKMEYIYSYSRNLFVIMLSVCKFYSAFCSCNSLLIYRLPGVQTFDLSQNMKVYCTFQMFSVTTPF